MGASKKKQIVNGHVKNFVQATFAHLLQEEAFISIEDRDISWIRIKNDEIVNTITFFTTWNITPIHLFIGYGIHPLFTDPFYSRRAYFCDRPLCFETFSEGSLFRPEEHQHWIKPFSEEIPVYAPSDGGVNKFCEKILPLMEKSGSFEECYALHKERYLKPEPDGTKIQHPRLSLEFIDEVIYAEDSEMYEICKMRLDQCIDASTKNIERFPNLSEYKDILNKARLQKHAFSSEDARLEYIATLEQKKKKNLAMLHKKFGII